MNLTAITEKEQVYEKHFYDSLTLAFENNINDLRLCDVGGGAGFPSIPLKIAFPSLDVTVVDSLAKRMTFINMVIDKLDLKGIRTVVARAEEYSIKEEETFDIVCARAVARLNILLEICVRLIKVGGRFIALKGSNAAEELKEAKNAVEKLSLKLEKEVDIVLPIEQSKRTNYVFRKVEKTKPNYPRNYSQIKKKPL